MGRLVRVPRALEEDELARLGTVVVAGKTYRNVQADNYLERVAKYVPAEVIAFFIFVNAILDQATKVGAKPALMAGFPVMTIAIIALLVACVVVPVFVWYVREEGDAWITNALVSTLAFPFWAYALGAVAFADYRDGNLAAILLASFTVVSGLIAPRAASVRRQEAVAPAPVERPQLGLVEINRL